jgi:hypothetical protein
MRLFTAILLVLLATPILAQDVPLPRPRPADRAPATEVLPELPTPVPLEVPDVATDVPDPPVAPPEEPEAPAVPSEPPEPPEPHQSACPAVVSGLVEAEMLPPIADGACIVASPLNVTGVTVNGRSVPLSSPATLSCAAATQLPAWAAAVDGYLQSKENTGLETLLTGTSYACRNINNGATGDLSAHAFGDAIDVTGFALADGRTISLPTGWTDPLSSAGRALRFAHDAACALFTTTLGPEANALHEDHLHLDMECHGARCTAQLCE